MLSFRTLVIRRVGGLEEYRVYETLKQKVIRRVGGLEDDYEMPKT